MIILFKNKVSAVDYMNNINEKILEGNQGIWDLIAEKELDQMEISNEDWKISELKQ